MSAARTRAGGWAVGTILAGCLVTNLVWIATHLGWLRPLEAGQPAPLVVLPRIVAEGRPQEPPITLGELRGQVVVLEFWATWCRPCLDALPVLDRAARTWGQRVTVLAVNLDDAGQARALFDREGYRLTLVADADDAAERYGVRSLPHVVVIDRAGVVRFVGTGGRGSRSVEAAVDRLLAADR